MLERHPVDHQEEWMTVHDHRASPPINHENFDQVKHAKRLCYGITKMLNNLNIPSLLNRHKQTGLVLLKMAYDMQLHQSDFLHQKNRGRKFIVGLSSLSRTSWSTQGLHRQVYIRTPVVLSQFFRNQDLIMIIMDSILTH